MTKTIDIDIQQEQKKAQEVIKAQGLRVLVCSGTGCIANGSMDVIEKFRELGAEVVVTTADGSAGIRGFVTDALKTMDYTYFFTCGPEAMLRAVNDEAPADIEGQFSFEERMGCGFGACMGCSCETKYGYKRICKEGPVLERGEILW